MKPQNRFWLLHAEYSAARRGYPSEVYEYLAGVLDNKSTPKTLDMGCGTGISTRELEQRGFKVIGADKEIAMLEAARRQSPNIQYIVATADSLPFDSESFDLVTAFTSFHWFNDEPSLKEIRRVLKVGGIFFAALKANRRSEEGKPFRVGYEQILKKYAGENFDSTKEHFRTEIVKNLFAGVTEKSFDLDELYTVDDALTLARSISGWNLISEDNRPKFLKELRDFYEKNLTDGLVLRKREVFTLVGTKAA